MLIIIMCSVREYFRLISSLWRLDPVYKVMYISNRYKVGVFLCNYIKNIKNKSICLSV